MSRVSNKVWSRFKESDYTLEQWCRACLIHEVRKPTAKSQCKLPVREPDGTLNRNGVHTAAAVLAGARGGVKTTPENKRRAARELVRLYRRELKEEPPESILRMAGMR